MAKGNVRMRNKEEVGWEILSVVPNEGTDYITVILELWQGDRDDPITSVNRYLALFDGTTLDGESISDLISFDPDYYGFKVKPEPLVWDQFKEVKESDDAARQHSSNEDHLINQANSGWGSNKDKANLFVKFLAAIDVLAESEEDEAAWTDITAWLEYQAHLHEK